MKRKFSDKYQTWDDSVLEYEKGNLILTATNKMDGQNERPQIVLQVRTKN